MIAVGAVLGIAFFAKEGDRIAEAFRSGGHADASRYLAVAALDTCLVLLAVASMVWRWRA